MTKAEQELLRAAASGRRAGLEFGCGGSTGLLLQAGLPRLLSADSDRGWLGQVGVDPPCVRALAEGRLRLLHIDIGPPGAWGWPAEPASMPRWPAYWRTPGMPPGRSIWCWSMAASGSPARWPACRVWPGMPGCWCMISGRGQPIARHCCGISRWPAAPEPW